MDKGARVYVTCPGLADLRNLMHNITGKKPKPNHHGTIETWEFGEQEGEKSALIHFDDGCAAPFPHSMIRPLPPEQEWRES